MDRGRPTLHLHAQHSKDRMFLTATEWKGLGGKKADGTNKSYRPLPFDACALSLQPFEVRPSVRQSVCLRRVLDE